eukprot:6492415-Amphidinium_carterae.2
MLVHGLVKVHPYPKTLDICQATAMWLDTLGSRFKAKPTIFAKQQGYQLCQLIQHARKLAHNLKTGDRTNKQLLPLLQLMQKTQRKTRTFGSTGRKLLRRASSPKKPDAMKIAAKPTVAASSKQVTMHDYTDDDLEKILGCAGSAARGSTDQLSVDESMSEHESGDAELIVVSSPEAPFNDVPYYDNTVMAERIVLPSGKSVPVEPKVLPSGKSVPVEPKASMAKLAHKSVAKAGATAVAKREVKKKPSHKGGRTYPCCKMGRSFKQPRHYIQVRMARGERLKLVTEVTQYMCKDHENVGKHLFDFCVAEFAKQPTPTFESVKEKAVEERRLSVRRAVAREEEEVFGRSITQVD